MKVKFVYKTSKEKKVSVKIELRVSTVASFIFESSEYKIKVIEEAKAKAEKIAKEQNKGGMLYLIGIEDVE